MVDRVEIDFQVRPAAWSYNEDRSMNPYTKSAIKNEWKTAAQIAFQQFKVHNPGVFVGTNKKSRATGEHHRVHALPGKWIVTLEIIFPTLRRRDPHNYCSTVLKAVIDGLVVAGAWRDDTPDYVGHREPLLIVDTTGRKMPKVILEKEVAHADADGSQESVSGLGGGSGGVGDQDDGAGDRATPGEQAGGPGVDRSGLGAPVERQADPDDQRPANPQPDQGRRFKL